jgi:hypothetical protein
MAQGLLGGVLPAIYSGADQLKRGVYGLLTNPMEQAERAGQSLLQSRADRQALMARTFANPERPFQVTDQAGLSQLTDQVMSGELGFAPAGITAFHGTPHNILGKFDISKVGTGEGAQAYGHGMYFAEAPAVAKEYQKALSNPEVVLKTGERISNPTLGSGEDVAKAWLEEQFLQGSKNPFDDALAKITKLRNSANSPAQFDDAAKILNNWKNQGATVDLGGNLYKVDIPDEYIPKMLDYDKPIKDQPEILKKVRALIKDPDMLKTFDNNVESGITGANVYANYVPTGVSKFALLKERDDLLNKYMKKDMGYSDAVRAMNPEDLAAFSEVAQKIDDLKNKPKLVSEVLNDIGIKGIKYLDQGSRGKGGTSNYVVFDPTDVKILERNSQPVEGLLD